LRFLNIAQGSLEEPRKLLQGYSSGIRRRMVAAAAGILMVTGFAANIISQLLSPIS
jgi:hypothetical protein